MRTGLLILLCILASCGGRGPVNRAETPTQPIRAALIVEEVDVGLYPGETPEMRVLVNRYADLYGVPRPLVHRVIQRESDYRARARNGPHYGLMQILPETARGMGFRGADSDLLKAETNLQHDVKYLRGAWLLSDGDMTRAIGFYARGYYYDARNRCMLVETGLRDTEIRKYCPNG